MNRTAKRRTLLVATLVGAAHVGVTGFDGPTEFPGTVVAAEPSLKIDGLSSDPKIFRSQVDQILSKVESQIAKLKANQNAQALVLDMMQTRDNILREIVKIEGTPGDAKWTSAEMRSSVQAMLMLLKEQYDKALGIGP